MELDSLDINLINEIQKKNSCLPRISFLAKKTGKAKTTIFQRLKKMEKEGVIETYSGKINPQKVGKSLVVWMLIAVESKKDFEKIGESFCKIPNVLEVHYVSGIYDFLIKARVADANEYYKLSTKYIQQFPGLVRTEGFITTKSFKESNFIFI